MGLLAGAPVLPARSSQNMVLWKKAFPSTEGRAGLVSPSPFTERKTEALTGLALTTSLGVGMGAEVSEGVIGSPSRRQRPPMTHPLLRIQILLSSARGTRLLLGHGHTSPGVMTSQGSWPQSCPYATSWCSELLLLEPPRSQHPYHPRCADEERGHPKRGSL